MSKPFNIAIALTWFRIAAIPAVMLAYMWPGKWAHPIAGAIFTLAAISDGLDGYLARRLGLTSRFGAFLDPVADKLMVSTALVLVVYGAPWWNEFLAVVAAIIIGREITISALREWMAEVGEGSKVRVSGFGKFKTIMQMVGLACMLITVKVWFLPVYEIGFACLVVAAVLTLYSMYLYLRAAMPQLTASD